MDYDEMGLPIETESIPTEHKQRYAEYQQSFDAVLMSMVDIDNDYRMNLEGSYFETFQKFYDQYFNNDLVSPLETVKILNWLFIQTHVQNVMNAGSSQTAYNEYLESQIYANNFLITGEDNGQT